MSRPIDRPLNRSYPQVLIDAWWWWWRLSEAEREGADGDVIEALKADRAWAMQACDEWMKQGRPRAIQGRQVGLFEEAA